MATVASDNPFSVLAEEASAPPATTPAPPTEKPKTETQAARGGQKGRSGGPASRGGRYYQRGGGVPSTPRETAETDEAAPREGKRFGDERGRGRGGRGRGRGERRGGGHGRIYDRQSATGKTDSDKKIAQGWGGPDGDRELQAEEQGTKDAAAEESTPADDAWGVATTGAAPADDPWGVASAPEVSGDAAKEEAEVETRRRREEEVDNTLTLDEYEAKLKETSSVPKLENVRQANDGADDLFKDAIQVVKPEEDAYFVPKSKAPKQRAKKEDKKAVPVNLVFDGPFADRPTRGRGGRGGERGSRGGRGRGGGGGGRGRGDGANGQAVNLRDESDFPSLSKS